MRAMTIDQAAAAYGLFQLAFAEVVDHIAGTLFALRQQKEADLSYSNVFGLNFGRQIRELEGELKTFDQYQSQWMVEHLGPLREACRRARLLSNWRNKRIHARVQRTEAGLALFDWRTLERLSISHDECAEKIDEALWIVGTLKCYAPHLVDHLDWLTLFESAFAEDES